MRAATAVLCVASALAQGAWTLVFEDDFNGPALNASNWNVKVNETHCEPCEPQLYIPSRVAVTNGSLVITTARDNILGPGGERFNFSSGWVDTRGKFSALYGRFEARAQLPALAATGIWPAFWTLPATDDCWPTQGEIDVYEYTANPIVNCVFGSYRWGTSCGNNNQVLPGAAYPANGSAPDDYWSSQFHVFGVEWNATTLSFDVDGVVYETKTSAEVNLPTVPQYVILNTAVAWYWPPGPTAVYPAYHVIDWVRVYQWTTAEDDGSTVSS